MTDFCYDAIVMKQDVLLCLLIGFWHLCHTYRNVHYSLCKLFLCDYIVLNLNFFCHLKPGAYLGFFQWGFYKEVDPECRSLETAPPDADENLILQTVKCQ